MFKIGEVSTVIVLGVAMANSEKSIQLFLVHLELEGETVPAQLTGEEIEIISNDANEYRKKFEEARRKETSNETELAGESGESKQKWSSNATRLLITLRLQKEEAFCNPKCKKIKLWHDISASMATKGYQYSGNECHAKYRNLIQTYKNNKDKRIKRTGESKISWEYFEQFDEVLGYKLSTAPTENILSSSMDVDSESTEEAIPNKENKCTDRSKEKKLSVTQYLYEKNKWRAVREEKDNLRWREKKILKEKEIGAINNLADAIRGDIKRKRIHSESE